MSKKRMSRQINRSQVIEKTPPVVLEAEELSLLRLICTTLLGHVKVTFFCLISLTLEDSLVWGKLVEIPTVKYSTSQIRCLETI